jgi:hypothetical protein
MPSFQTYDAAIVSPFIKTNDSWRAYFPARGVSLLGKRYVVLPSKGLPLCLQVLDEPAVHQSDPAVLNLQLRQLSRDAPGARLEVVGKVEHGDSQKAKRIGAWMQGIADVHKNRPLTSIVYSQPMPDVEVLMQEWPPELEAALNSMKLPSSQLVRNAFHWGEGWARSSQALYKTLLSLNPSYSRV